MYQGFETLSLFEVDLNPAAGCEDLLKICFSNLPCIVISKVIQIGLLKGLQNNTQKCRNVNCILTDVLIKKGLTGSRE